MADELDLVTLLQLKSASERISSVIAGLLTDEEKSAIVDDADLASAVSTLQGEHSLIMVKLDEIKDAKTYVSAEELSF